MRFVSSVLTLMLSVLGIAFAGMALAQSDASARTAENICLGAMCCFTFLAVAIVALIVMAIIVIAILVYLLKR